MSLTAVVDDDAIDATATVLLALLPPLTPLSLSSLSARVSSTHSSLSLIVVQPVIAPFRPSTLPSFFRRPRRMLRWPIVMIVGSPPPPPLWSPPPPPPPFLEPRLEEKEMLCAQRLHLFTSQGPRMGALTQMMPTKVSRMAQMVETSTSLA
ncbi:hypothetical protein BBAD15_g4628 [Beauveria bassiana D1-5]|uniref:Uncharacterized protein n=1 Tax=Beauveria bassiana D1-5 TaxID=1245745 RepID=A0A0A2VUJ6_BEABA|nr:hypothetical protein BBAD15_g4628 [Beauveria bassiana D1-5]